MHHFLGTEKVLDIGCGSGQISAFIAAKLAPQGEVTGIDISGSMTEEANRGFSGKLKNIMFQKGDAANFTLDQTFDLIVSFSALHWVPDQTSVWKGIRNHLKIGGLALISLNPLPRDRWLTHAINKTVSSPKWTSYFNGFKEQENMLEMTIEEYRKIVMTSETFTRELVGEFLISSSQTSPGKVKLGYTHFLVKALRVK